MHGGYFDGKRQIMAKTKEIKTNAMRILDSMKIPYTHYAYECDEFVDGMQTADRLGLPYDKVFKTLVTQGNSRNYFVFVIPIDKELDLKKAAKSVGEKSVEMIHVKDINAVTGYIRGGCTSIGMKKQYVTRIDESAAKQPDIYVSGGRIGCQINLKPDDLLKAAKAEYAALTF
jgi:Cys-tRNA(Pro)/Cys-tRNA(Cys) deacylase